MIRLEEKLMEMRKIVKVLDQRLRWLEEDVRNEQDNKNVQGRNGVFSKLY